MPKWQVGYLVILIDVACFRGPRAEKRLPGAMAKKSGRNQFSDSLA